MGKPTAKRQILSEIPSEQPLASSLLLEIRRRRLSQENLSGDCNQLRTADVCGRCFRSLSQRYFTRGRQGQRLP